jgi:PTS system trehalose-specific IIC component
LGLTLEKVGYQGQVLPVIVSAFVLVRLELWLNKKIPDAFKLLLVAPIALLITGFLSFMVIGPVTFAIANGLTFGLVFIFTKFALAGGLIFGALYAPIVITGMHQSFLAIDFQLIASTGGALLWPMVALSNIAQGSSALAMMVLAKDEKLKGLSFTSAISAFLGITEPAMFGVNLRFKIPFFCAMTGSALAAALIAVNGVKASAIGVGGLPAFLSIMPRYWLIYFMAMGIVLLVPFLLTLIFAKKINWGVN